MRLFHKQKEHAPITNIIVNNFITTIIIGDSKVDTKGLAVKVEAVTEFPKDDVDDWFCITDDGLFQVSLIETEKIQEGRWYAIFNGRVA